MPSLREVMSKDPLTTPSTSTMAQAAADMVHGRVGSLLVKDGHEVVGILTERDMLRAAGADGDLLSTRVLDWMTTEPTTAPADQDVADALHTMLDGGFRHLPVTEAGEVVGIVSLRRLVGAHIGGSERIGRIDDPDANDSAPTESPSEVRRRRERLFDATRGLREVSRMPVDDADRWRAGLGQAIDVLADVLAAHVAQTEGPGGFFEELVHESSGRLTAGVRRLRREHERSTSLVEQLRRSIDDGADPALLQQAADKLSAQLEAHRHRGSDLLWQAYGTEIGGDG